MGEKRNKDELTVRYAFIQCFFWMMFGGAIGFVSVYLLDCGFNNTQIGLLIAVAGLFSAILQPMMAGYADKEKSPSLKILLILFLLVQVVVNILLLAVHHKSAIFTGSLYALLLLMMQMLVPLVNALGMESINQKKRLNFGVARGTGSMGYAFVVYVVGIVAGKIGAVAVPAALLLVSSMLLVGVFFFPFQKTLRQVSETAEEEKGNLFLFFKKYPRFCVTLVGCVLVYISHVLLNSFTFQIVREKGGGSAEMGSAMAMASLFELPTMFLFAFMLKKVRCDIWFRISGIFFFLKTLGTLLAPNISSFYAVQVFQMLGWALITVSSVYYVNSIMEKQDAIKGQAYMTMTYTLGSVAGALVGGALIDSLGVISMLGFATVSAAAGMVIMLLTAQKAK
ncbi:MAG: MFS transporter [Lachnospiraceae bacterium]|nr:MFS transporter [Lachnospiraceae bacterium]